ncbi:tetratricopeptide repeat protein [Lishizhenia sp.]|uniref:tetratricopeptide repeat protein n=1 Tax=Lishizhenia sp. TaxID=2497594 RepID=UPI00299D4847|nr:tetratricopeptide repeat protein [Lishizhenia sp.]MDX1445458.1 tetratricopeptide repeat protein [Lishizhenia sp.]
MKFIAVFTFLLLSCTVNAQQWREEFREGNRLYEEGKYQEAYNHFITAQQQAPENIDISREISRAAYRKGEFKEAAENFYNQLQDAKSQEEKAALYHNMGNCNMKDKNYAEAIENYKNALRMNPSAKETRYNLAEAKRRLKKQEEEQQKNQKQQDQQNQQDQNKNQQQQNQQNQNQQNKEGQPKQGDGQSQKSQNNSSSNSSPQQSDKLSSKKTERLLDELMKQEMNTKRKLRGMGSGGKQEKVKSGKRW